MAGQQELWNVMKKEGLKNLIYMGVHENMCIMGRPFAIENVAGWGMGKDNVAVMRELVDGKCRCGPLAAARLLSAFPRQA